jgi:hypothetical protein
VIIADHKADFISLKTYALTRYINEILSFKMQHLLVIIGSSAEQNNRWVSKSSGPFTLFVNQCCKNNPSVSSLWNVFKQERIGRSVRARKWMGMINGVTMMTIICNIVAMMTNTIIGNRPLLWPGGSLAEEPCLTFAGKFGPFGRKKCVIHTETSCSCDYYS